MATLSNDTEVLTGSIAITDRGQGKVNDFTNADYLIEKEILKNPYHIAVTRTHLARNLAHYYPDLRDEIETAFNEIFDLKDNGTAESDNIFMMDADFQKNGRPSQPLRLYVKSPAEQAIEFPSVFHYVNRDPDWIHLTSQFAVGIVIDACLLNMFPKFLVPLVANFTKRTAMSTERAMRHLGPIIKERLKYMSDYGDEWTDKPVSRGVAPARE
ncbi:hypothetical protein ID866_9297 [Astraeus odoratus]|nr:hypothetical protein ID866_9297 [Astraeus odoratus]